MTKEELQASVDSFKWYHEIEIDHGVVTKPAIAFRDSWDLIDIGMKAIDFEGKRVLDVGTRDGKYAFIAEEMGAHHVVAIDTCPSSGARFLKDYKGSLVEFLTHSVYDVNQVQGFDVVLFFGVLYHLRYPMKALRGLSQSLKMDGRMYIETAVLNAPGEMAYLPLLYCPVKTSPYEITSCSFFNIPGLIETAESMGLETVFWKLSPVEQSHNIRRCWIELRKVSNMDPALQKYWEGLHNAHS